MRLPPKAEQPWKDDGRKEFAQNKPNTRATFSPYNDGGLRMFTHPLDLQALLQESIKWSEW